MHFPDRWGPEFKDFVMLNARQDYQSDFLNIFV